jgi:hypothetical protein
VIKQLEIARLGEITEVTEKTVVLYRNSLLTKHVTHDINIMHNILKGHISSNSIDPVVFKLF